MMFLSENMSISLLQERTRKRMHLRKLYMAR